MAEGFVHGHWVGAEKCYYILRQPMYNRSIFNPTHHEQTKHIDIKNHFIQNVVVKEKVVVRNILTIVNLWSDDYACSFGEAWAILELRHLWRMNGHRRHWRSLHKWQALSPNCERSTYVENHWACGSNSTQFRVVSKLGDQELCSDKYLSPPTFPSS